MLPLRNSLMGGPAHRLVCMGIILSFSKHKKWAARPGETLVERPVDVLNVMLVVVWRLVCL